mgnify:CR=1 FL=1
MFIKVFLSFSHHLTVAIARLTFQMMGPHNLIGSSRSVKIFEAASGSSSSGSKAYFLSKVHNLASSGWSGRQQQWAIWLGSRILDTCEIKNFDAVTIVDQRENESWFSLQN